jgi:hypothetical protein
MTELILAIAGVIGAAAGWFFRGSLAGRAEEKLKNQRDAALVEAERQRTQAAAKTAETAVMRQQTDDEDAIHAASQDNISSRLDGLFD